MRQFLLIFITINLTFFYSIVWAASADSTKVAILDRATTISGPAGIILGTGSISVTVSTNNATPYTLYFNTKNRVCPYGLHSSVVTGIDAAGSQNFTGNISAFEVLPVSNLVTSSNISAWGDQGFQSYGSGYYRNYSFQVRGENPPFVFIVSYRVSCEN